jgi:hypothetical protein
MLDDVYKDQTGKPFVSERTAVHILQATGQHVKEY